MRVSFLGTEDNSAVVSGYAEFDSIADGYLSWWDITNAWLSAWHNMPSHYPDLSRDSLLHVVGADGGIAGMGVTGGLVVLNAPAASVAEIRGAFVHASRNERLPLAWELLLASRNAVWGKDYRLATIEAGSAAEVALATAIRERLRSQHVKPAYIEAAVEDANGVIGLYDQYVALVGPLPRSKGAVMSKLAVMRNRSAHAGAKPTAEDAREALVVSQSLVDAVLPLSTP